MIVLVKKLLIIEMRVQPCVDVNNASLFCNLQVIDFEMINHYI